MARSGVVVVVDEPPSSDMVRGMSQPSSCSQHFTSS